MKLFTKSEESSTKCKKCGLELHDAERLKKHEKLHMEEGLTSSVGIVEQSLETQMT